MDSGNRTLRIVGISGSLRKGSFSTALLRVLEAKLKPSIELEVITLEDIPLYNEDLDHNSAIPAVANLKLRISEGDGILIVTPEYNYGIPGVLKNALDWVSRPAYQSVIKNKPVSIISESRAITGGVRAQNQLRETLVAMQARLVPGPEVVVGSVHTKLLEGKYQDQEGLAFILASVARLRDEVLGFSSTLP